MQECVYVNKRNVLDRIRNYAIEHPDEIQVRGNTIKIQDADSIKMIT